MESLLARWHPGVVTGVPAHYRLVATAEPLAAHQASSDAVIAARVFSAAQPSRVSGLRITTPTATELPRLAGAPARQ
jgi:hypothetical protein